MTEHQIGDDGTQWCTIVADAVLEKVAVAGVAVENAHHPDFLAKSANVWDGLDSHPLTFPLSFVHLR